jgi:hypothetical protein
MKTTRTITTTAAIAILAVISLIHPGSGRAQDKTPRSTLTTNWVGFLVTGEIESGDPMAGRGPFPKADKTVVIGLRSDGVVIWKNAPSDRRAPR